MMYELAYALLAHTARSSPKRRSTERLYYGSLYYFWLAYALLAHTARWCGYRDAIRRALD